MKLWILGARDPEMILIERLLRAAGESVFRLTVRGKHCYPGNAYRGDRPRAEAGTRLIRVECDWKGSAGALVVDHHRPGDPGFGTPPAGFARGSSVGQVIAWLARWGQLDRLADVTPPWVRRTLPASSAREPGVVCCENGVWWVATETADYRVPDEVLFVAAGDHCLGAAYQGACPGVQPEALAAFRVARDAQYRSVSEETVLHDLEDAHATLLAAPRLRLGPDVIVADLRVVTYREEVNEAAARWGLPFVAQLHDRSGRRKIVLRVATPVVMAAWPAWAAAQGLADLYGGDPQRGFAGGYLPGLPGLTA